MINTTSSLRQANANAVHENHAHIENPMLFLASMTRLTYVNRAAGHNKDYYVINLPHPTAYYHEIQIIAWGRIGGKHQCQTFSNSNVGYTRISEKQDKGYKTDTGNTGTMPILDAIKLLSNLGIDHTKDSALNKCISAWQQIALKPVGVIEPANASEAELKAAELL